MRQSREAVLAKKREWVRSDRLLYPEKYREREKESSRKKRENNPEKCRAIQSKYRDKYRARIRQKGRLAYWQNHAKELLRGRGDPNRALRATEWIKRNPGRRKEIMLRYRELHKEEIAAYYAGRVASGKTKESARRWRKANLGKARRCAREYIKRISVERPEERIIRNCVSHMMKAAHMTKNARSRQYVGCSPQFLRNHLEGQFRSGMSWANYGSVWEVDHIVPLSWWDVRNHPEHILIASHWSNLQPLFVEENAAKKHFNCRRIAA